LNSQLDIRVNARAICRPDGAGTRPRRRSQQAFTLVEVMVASSISVLVLATVMVSFVVISRSFNALGNYADLDRQSRNTLDVMARDIRQTGGLTNWTSTTLSFTNLDGQALNYFYDTHAQLLSYTNGSTGQSSVLLSNCASLAFSIFQRTPTNGPVSFYTASNAFSAKGILLSFTCLRTNYLGLTDSESSQSASFVIRN
jgi:prepilin-type N-terminal cleavage/methylation domain-containing protein